MPSLVFLLSLLLAACAPAPPPEPLTPPHEAVERITATLQDAVRLDHEGRSQEALESWARARDEFTTSVDPWLAEHHGQLRSNEVAYELSLIHRELTARRGTPSGPVKHISEALAELLVVAPTPPATPEG